MTRYISLESALIVIMIYVFDLVRIVLGYFVK